jgi:hypothetical protein
VPAWTWLVISLLSLGLVALAVAWWQSSTSVAPPTTAIETEAPATEPAAVETRPAAEPEIAPPASLSPQPISGLRALDPNLPEYRLELIAHNNQDPAQGSAWINGRRYYVGERIGSGPELVEVRPDSVVLAYGGSRFLLTTR